MPNHRKSRGKNKILFYVDDDIFEHIKEFPSEINITETLNDILRLFFMLFVKEENKNDS